MSGSNSTHDYETSDEDWRVFLPEEEPLEPLPEYGDFPWEYDPSDFNDAA